MKITLRPLDSIRPYERNPRINAPAVDAVARSIRDFGFRKPLVVDDAGVIVCGHTCYLAARQLGLERVPVHVAADLSPAQIKAYRIADNKTAELAEWDWDLLPLELADLQEADYDVSGLGFDAAELSELLGSAIQEGLCDPDEIPAPPATAKTRRGDSWLLGEHRLRCGDSASVEDLDRLLAGAAVHLVHTDPPYNVKVEPRSNNAIAAGRHRGATHHQSFDAARRPRSAKPTSKQLRAKDRPLANDFVRDDEFARLLAGWFQNIGRVLSPGRSFYLWGGYANIANYPPALQAAGLYHAQSIIWVKEHPVLTRKDYMGNHEWCFYGWPEGGPHEFFGGHNQADTWQVGRARDGVVRVGSGVRLEAEDGGRVDILPPRSERLRTVQVPAAGVTLYASDAATDVWTVKKVAPAKMVHLTEKPVELAARALRNSSRAGEHVLDLFGGSGSTLIAAEQTGRRAFLMELDPLYCDVIVARWERFTGERARREGEPPPRSKRPAAAKR